jgi:hypothetical protein
MKVPRWSLQLQVPGLYRRGTRSISGKRPPRHLESCCPAAPAPRQVRKAITPQDTPARTPN